MNVEQVYRKIKNDLTKAGNDSPAFDSLCLIEKVLGYNRTSMIVHNGDIVSEEKINELESLTKRRISYEPLQYIIGKWSFMGIDFFVGNGVLIPRDDTEVVTELCIDFLLKKKSADNKCEVMDLCAGSGAISLALEKYANAQVTSVEISLSAFEYLVKNIEYNNSLAKPVNADIFDYVEKVWDNSLDLIVSNPPYIKTEEINTLQEEVKKEPKLALDGGADGYYFYEKIIPLWKSKLKCGGAMAFELGEGQSEYVGKLLSENGFSNIKYSDDLGGITRAVIAEKNL